MSVRLTAADEELNIGTGLDPESRYVRQRYQILDWDADDDALRELANETQTTFSLNLPLPNTPGAIHSVTFYRQPLTVRRLGFQTYESDVTWNLRSQTEFDIKVSTRTTGGTQKFLSSFFTANKGERDGKPPPDFKGLVGYKEGSQEVEGYEIIMPVMERDMEVTYPDGYCSDHYLDSLADLTGCVNNSQWQNRRAGEVLYMGAEYSKGTSAPTIVRHRIGISPNLYKQRTAGMTVTKDGWDYLWLTTRKTVLTVPGVAGPVPGVEATAWYSERVYRREDFKAFLGF